MLLLLYEFEARIQLKDPAVEAVLEKALTMSGLDPKIFETLAGQFAIHSSHSMYMSLSYF